MRSGWACKISLYYIVFGSKFLSRLYFWKTSPDSWGYMRYCYYCTTIKIVGPKGVFMGYVSRDPPLLTIIYNYHNINLHDMDILVNNIVDFFLLKWFNNTIIVCIQPFVQYYNINQFMNQIYSVTSLVSILFKSWKLIQTRPS